MLQSLYIPSTLKKFDSYVLLGSGKSLALYLTEPSNYYTCISNKFLLSKDKTTIVAASPRVVNSDLNLLPQETRIIGGESFGTSSLGPTVTFPSQIEEIRNQRQYIETRLEERDRLLMQSIRESMEVRKEIAAASEKKWWRFWK